MQGQGATGTGPGHGQRRGPGTAMGTRHGHRGHRHGVGAGDGGTARLAPQRPPQGTSPSPPTPGRGHEEAPGQRHRGLAPQVGSSVQERGPPGTPQLRGLCGGRGRATGPALPSEDALLAGPAEAPRAATLQPAGGQEPAQGRGGAQVPAAPQVDAFLALLRSRPGAPGDLQPHGDRLRHCLPTLWDDSRSRRGCPCFGGSPCAPARRLEAGGCAGQDGRSGRGWQRRA